MAMQMQRAFNSRMLTKVIRYVIEEGTYDEENIWVEGRVTKKNIYGVIKSGNKFSQFEEGEAVHSEDGGTRFSQYKTLYVTDRFPIYRGDKVGYAGNFYNVLQRSEEAEYGFFSVLLEKSTEWKP
ncbi:MAG: hypothetical protein NZ811_00125 [Gammaproteobacteria bacterium]|nr:hypothetical protein [Gammaproteobacteria bacterium]